MGHFYVWKFQARHRLLAILILAFICATFIYTKSPITLPTFTQDKPVAITKGNDKEKRLLLLSTLVGVIQKYMTFYRS